MPKGIDEKIASTISNFFTGQPVEKAWVFGSFPRGEQTPGSDIYIMALFLPDARVTLLTFAGMACSLKEKQTENTIATL